MDVICECFFKLQTVQETPGSEFDHLIQTHFQGDVPIGYVPVTSSFISALYRTDASALDADSPPGEKMDLPCNNYELFIDDKSNVLQVSVICETPECQDFALRDADGSMSSIASHSIMGSLAVSDTVNSTTCESDEEGPNYMHEDCDSRDSPITAKVIFFHCTLINRSDL